MYGRGRLLELVLTDPKRGCFRIHLGLSDLKAQINELALGIAELHAVMVKDQQHAKHTGAFVSIDKP